MTPIEHQTDVAQSRPESAKVAGIAAESIPDTLAAFNVNPDTGLTKAEVDTQRKKCGYNEVAEKKGHPALKFLKKLIVRCQQKREGEQ